MICQHLVSRTLCMMTECLLRPKSVAIRVKCLSNPQPMNHHPKKEQKRPHYQDVLLQPADRRKRLAWSNLFLISLHFGLWQIQQRPQSPQMTKAQILEAIARHEEDPRLAKLIYIQEKRTSNKMRAEANVRPKR